MNNEFVMSYVMSADIELWGGYHMEYLSEDQWKIYQNTGNWSTTGTLDECCAAYRWHWQQELKHR